MFLGDIVNDFHMGISNDLCSEKYGVSRDDQDAFSLRSHQRAAAAIDGGDFLDEITPVPVSAPRRRCVGAA